MKMQFPIFDGEPACIEVGGDMFYPEGGSGLVTSAYQAVRKVCIGCEIREQCAEWAINANEREGMWGGLTPRERQVIRRRRGLVEEAA